MENLDYQHNSNSGSQNTMNFWTYVRSKARVFFVRHGRSVEDTWEPGWTPQSDNAELDNIGKKQMEEIATYLTNAGIGNENDILLYGDDTKRVRESVRIVIQQVVSENDLWKKVTSKLRTTKKWLKWIKRLKEDRVVFIDTTILMEQIRRWVNIYLKWNNSWVVLIWHKSNKSWILQVLKNVDEKDSITYDIENGEIIELDIDASSGNYINPKKHPEIIFLNKSNYIAILKSLEKIPELKDSIQKFQNNWKLWDKYPIWKLQNDINEYFYIRNKLFTSL